MGDNRDYETEENNMSSVRTWPDEKVAEARRRLEDARRVHSEAERLYMAGKTDRAAQERDELRIKRESDRGEPYYWPKDATLEEHSANMMKTGNWIVYRWITDDELVVRRDASEAAREALEKAEKAYEAARAKATPTTEPEMRQAGEAIGAIFAVNREMKISGTVYPAGAPVPTTITDQIDHWKLQRWADAGLVRRLD